MDLENCKKWKGSCISVVVEAAAPTHPHAHKHTHHAAETLLREEGVLELGSKVTGNRVFLQPLRTRPRKKAA